VGLQTRVCVSFFSFFSSRMSSIGLQLSLWFHYRLWSDRFHWDLQLFVVSSYPIMVEWVPSGFTIVFVVPLSITVECSVGILIVFVFPLLITVSEFHWDLQLSLWFHLDYCRMSSVGI
jgi:hypothetical protein